MNSRVCGKILFMNLSGNTFYMLRHAEATHNVSGYIASGETEKTERQPKLTQRGKEQVTGVAEELYDKDIGTIYASPYKRTVETASIIAEKLGLKIKLDARLGEIDMGVFDGKDIEEYREFFKNGIDRFTKTIEDGESLSDVKVRAKLFLDDVLKNHKDENILVVSHGGTLWMMDSILLNTGENILDILHYEPGEFKIFN